MDVREKLVELLQDENNPVWRWFPNNMAMMQLSDYLISNGVTVQEWIPVKDKLPPYNHDVLVYRPNMAMKIVVDSYDGYYGEDDGEWYEGWAKYGKDIHNNPLITHWMPLRNPPKGE